MSKTKSLHYDMCCEAAKILHRRGLDGTNPHKYVVVELITYGREDADVWGTNGAATTLVEVKTSRADFLKDREKQHRKDPISGMGNFRWYYALEGIIKEAELPENWGLVEADESGKMVRLVRIASYQESTSLSSISILCSIMRREGIKGKVFNYRKKKL